MVSKAARLAALAAKEAPLVAEKGEKLPTGFHTVGQEYNEIYDLLTLQSAYKEGLINEQEYQTILDHEAAAW